MGQQCSNLQMHHAKCVTLHKITMNGNSKMRIIRTQSVEVDNFMLETHLPKEKKKSLNEQKTHMTLPQRRM